MQTNEQLTNYLLWLSERGMTIPVYRDTSTDSHMSDSPGGEVYSFGGISPRILFVGDGGSPLSPGERGPLPEEEMVLLQKIAKALKLTIDDFHYTNYFKCPMHQVPAGEEHVLAHRRHFLQTVALLKPAGIVILGGHALNFVSGKTLNLNALRGKVFAPELYGIPTIATYHLRDMLQFPENKSLVWADLNLLTGHLKHQELS